MESTGRLDQALAQHRKNLALAPEDPSIQNDVAYLLVETGGDLDEALRLVQQAARKLPNHPAVNDTLGWVYLKRNMTDSALKVFTGLVKKQPENPFFQYHLAAALYASGDKDGARNALKSSLANKPSPLAEKKIKELLGRLG
jgi:Flp pilus assembly protein TadD